MEIQETRDGSHTIYSDDFEAPYHSKYGAIQESEHVFIEAALLPAMQDHSTLKILEIGFGTGLNALLTFVNAINKGINVEYTAYEYYPVSLDILQQLNFYKYLDKFENAKALQNWLHHTEWDKQILFDNSINTTIHLHKVKDKFEHIKYSNEFDIIYFDAFAPIAQPELWTEQMFTQMYEALVPGGVLTTYCAKGQVRRNIRAAGFIMQSLPGPVGKWEMTRAVKPL